MLGQYQFLFVWIASQSGLLLFVTDYFFDGLGVGMVVFPFLFLSGAVAD